MLNIMVICNYNSISKTICDDNIWQDLNCQIVGAMPRNYKSVELISIIRPDIILIHTDSYPAFPNGESTLEANIFITSLFHYSFFPYCIGFSSELTFDSLYHAIKCGVSDFISYPLNHSEIAETVKNAYSQINIKNMRQKQNQEFKNTTHNRRATIRKQIINQLIFNDSDFSELPLDDITGGFLFNFKPGFYEAIIIKPDFLSPTSEENMTLLLNSLGKLTEETLQEHCIDLIWYIRNFSIICVSNFSSNLQAEYEKLLPILQQKAGPFTSITLAVGTNGTALKNIQSSVFAAQSALESRITLGVGKIIRFGDISFMNLSLSKIITPAVEYYLINNFESLQSSNIVSKIIEIFDTMSATKDLHPHLYFELGRSIAQLLERTITKNNMLPESNPISIHDFEKFIASAYTVEMLRNSIILWVTRIIDSVLYEKKQQDDKPIRIAKEYINKHYAEEIKLSNLANEVHLNPAYFSSLFKSKTGINFNQYLIECRLQAAKELLRSTNLNITQITERVGYNDTKYFSKLFKKELGMSPSEYRKLYS